MGPDAMILVFWILSFKPTYSLSSFTFIKRLFSPLHFLPYEWYYLHIWGYWFYGFIIPLFSSSLFGRLQLPSLTDIDPRSPALYLSRFFYSRPPHSQKFLQSLCLHCLDIWVLIQKPIWPGGVVRLLRVQTLQRCVYSFTVLWSAPCNIIHRDNSKTLFAILRDLAKVS